MDGADRVKPRPGNLRHDVEGWRANPPCSGNFPNGRGRVFLTDGYWESLVFRNEALFIINFWSGARAAESGSLLRSCAPKGYRGFESPLLRIGFLKPEIF